MKYVLYILFGILFLFSCKEEKKKSKLIIPKLENGSVKAVDPFAYVTDTMSYAETMNLTNSDFKLDFNIDSNAKHDFQYNEYVASCTLTNLTNKTIYFQGFSCNGFSGLINFGMHNSHTLWTLNCNINYQTREYLKGNDKLTLWNYINIDSKKDSITPVFKLNLISFHCNERSVKPIKRLTIRAESKPIPKWININ